MLQTQTCERVADWQPWRRWVAASARSLFATDAGFEWFARRHRAELIRSGQFIVRKGRVGAIVGPEIDGVVLAILRREAADAAAQEGGAPAGRAA